MTVDIGDLLRRPPRTGAGLRRLRELHRLTQAQFAAAVGVHRVTVARWESRGLLTDRATDTMVLAAMRARPRW